MLQKGTKYWCKLHSKTTNIVRAKKIGIYVVVSIGFYTIFNVFRHATDVRFYEVVGVLKRKFFNTFHSNKPKKALHILLFRSKIKLAEVVDSCHIRRKHLRTWLLFSADVEY